ncbi:MAG: hypothetical protein IJ298_07860 [Ruminococcus sp.]|nr:hypothetical protein [Ruminococcus sp.]
MSNSIYFPEVGDQGQIGSCTSWAAVYYQFGYQVASKYSLDVTSTNNLFSPKWVHNIAKSSIGNTGSYYEDVYKVLKSNGAVRYSEFAPTKLGLSSNEVLAKEYLPWYLDETALTNALKYRVANYHFLEFSNNSTDTPITSYNSTCLNNMKTFLSTGSILTFSTDFGYASQDLISSTLSSQSNEDLNGDYVCIRVNNTSGQWEGHAMAIVGYNDNITYDLNGDGTIQNFERGAFKIVNSHSSGWRNNGYIWIMYDALNKVSNTNNQNTPNRNAAFYNYGYNVINIKEYPNDVIAKITLNHNNRTQINVDLVVSNSDGISYIDTMLLQNTESEDINFSGTGNATEENTFVFDFGDLYALDTSRSTCGIHISDEEGGNPTIVKKVELIDNTGKTIVIDSSYKTINGATKIYSYKLGIVGDVNDDTNITTSDISLIQRYLAGITTLTNEDLLSADVNGDGVVTVSDATIIQKYIAGNIDKFPNGSIVLLS